MNGRGCQNPAAGGPLTKVERKQAKRGSSEKEERQRGNRGCPRRKEESIGREGIVEVSCEGNSST
jgi:hypothetical protein